MAENSFDSAVSDQDKSQPLPRRTSLKEDPEAGGYKSQQSTQVSTSHKEGGSKGRSEPTDNQNGVSKATNKASGKGKASDKFPLKNSATQENKEFINEGLKEQDSEMYTLESSDSKSQEKHVHVHRMRKCSK